MIIPPVDGGPNEACTKILYSITSLEVRQTSTCFYVSGMSKHRHCVFDITTFYPWDLSREAVDFSYCMNGIARELSFPNLESLSMVYVMMNEDPIAEVLKAYPTLHTLTEVTYNLSSDSCLLGIVAKTRDGKPLCPNPQQFRWAPLLWRVKNYQVSISFKRCLRRREELIGSKLHMLTIGAPPYVYDEFDSIEESPELEDIVPYLAKKVSVIDWYPESCITVPICMEGGPDMVPSGVIILPGIGRY